MMDSLYVEDLDDVLSENLPWEKLKGKKVLVTGATGLIGSCIVDVLMRLNYVKVFAMGRNLEKGKNRFSHYFCLDNFEFICHDVSNKLELALDFDYIIHAASGAHPFEFNNNPVETMIGNFLGTYNLLEYARQHKIERFVYVSSAEVYGEAIDEVSSFNEEYSGYVNPVSVRSCYPSAKRATETLLVSYAKEYNLAGVIVRPCHIYGPTMTKDDSRVVAEFIRAAVNGDNIELKSSGKQFRGYTYVTDVVSALFYIMFFGNNSEAYNISGEDIVSIKELAEIISGISGRELIFSGDNIGKNIRTVLNNEKISKLGWRSKIRLDDGIKRTIDILKRV